MPLVYTPTVGLGCQLFSLLFQHPRGLFITIHDKGHVYDILKVYSLNEIISLNRNLIIVFRTELARDRCSSNRRYGW